MKNIELESFQIPVVIRGAEISMSLTRHGEIWTLEGEGLSATSRTSREVFVHALGIIDGKKAAKKWEEVNKGGDSA